MPPVLAIIAMFAYLVGDKNERSSFSLTDWFLVLIGALLLCGVGWCVIEALLWLIRHISISVAW